MLKLATKFAPRRAAFETAYQAGFRYAEFWLNDQWLARRDQIVDVARYYPMRYVPHFPNKGPLADESLEQAAALYRSLDCHTMVIHQTVFDPYGPRLCEIDPSVRLAVENPELTPAQLDEWAERYSGLTLDIEHFWLYTFSDASLDEILVRLRKFLTRFGEKLLHVHLGGCAPGGEEHRPLYCSRDLAFRVFSLLADFDYQGFIVAEPEIVYQTAPELRMDALLFEAWRAQHEGRSTTD